MPPLPTDASYGSLSLWVMGVLLAFVAGLARYIFKDHIDLVKENKELAAVVQVLQASASKFQAEAAELRGSHTTYIECVQRCSVQNCAFRDARKGGGL